MAVQAKFVSSASVAGSAVTTIDIPMPAGTVNGNILLACIYIEAFSVTVSSAPAGFTSLADWTNSSGNRTSLYWKLASGETGAVYNFQATGASWFGGWIACFSGADTVNPWSVTGSGSSGNDVSPVASSITTTSTNDLILYISANTGGSAYTPPTGMTERIDATPGTLAEVLQYVPGATGTKTGTITSSQWVAGLLALNAAPGPSFTERSRRPAPFKPGLAR